VIIVDPTGSARWHQHAVAAKLGPGPSRSRFPTRGAGCPVRVAAAVLAGPPPSPSCLEKPKRARRCRRADCRPPKICETATEFTEPERKTPAALTLN
jgi:hypothetical protein